MKTRNGFVSNSSASSFCIFGCSLDLDDKALAKFKGDEVEEDDCDDGDRNWIYETLTKAAQKVGLEVNMLEYGENIYIGRDLKTIKDDETGKDFKEFVKAGLKNLLGKVPKCEMIEQAEGQ